MLARITAGIERLPGNAKLLLGIVLLLPVRILALGPAQDRRAQDLGFPCQSPLLPGTFLPTMDVIANFVPESFFAGLEQDQVWALWLLAAGAIVLLVFGADRVVSAAVKLATALGMSKVVIGATIVSLGTTSPEMFTSVTAAFSGKPDLALGNGIGSIICDTGLIFGLAACMQRLPLDRRIQDRHGRLQLGAGLLLAAVVGGLALLSWRIDGLVIPRWVGVVFVGLLAGYLWMSVRWARQFPDLIPDEVKKVRSAKAQSSPKATSALGNLVGFAIGLALVLLGSNLLVGSATCLCTKYGVPRSVLAATLVAFGTSLPELVTAMASLARGHGDLLVGNIMGADILNVLFVIGLSATASPLTVDRPTVLLLLPVMLLVLILFRVFVVTAGGRSRRWQGAVLLAVYLGYVATLITFGVQVEGH